MCNKNNPTKSINFAFTFKSIAATFTEFDRANMHDLCTYSTMCKAKTSACYELYKQYVTTGNKRYKVAADTIKRQLPYFVPSGEIEGTKRNDAAITGYTGCVIIDYDDKKTGGDKAARAAVEAIQRLFRQFAHVALLGISPSGYGFKAIVLTDAADKAAHKVAATQVQSWFISLCTKHGVQVKNECFDAVTGTLSQGHYIPTNVVLNTAATPLHIDEAAAAAAVEQAKQVKQIEVDSDVLQAGDTSCAAVDYLLTCNDFANSYDDYLKLLASCLGAFGRSHGAAVAWSLLVRCDAFLRSDFARKFESKAKGIKAVKLGLNYLEQLAAKHGQPNSNQTELLQLQAGERFSDLLLRTFGNAWATEFYGKSWQVGTGVGKTYAAIMAAKTSGERTIFAAPTRVLAQQVAATYNVYSRIGGHDKSNNALADLHAQQIIVTTYSNLQNIICELGDVAKYNLVIDESHQLVTAGQMVGTVRAIVQSLHLFKSVTTLTATPVHLIGSKLETLKRVKVEGQTNEIKATIVTAKSIRGTAVKEVTDARAAGKKCIVWLNDKGDKLTKFKLALDDIGVTYAVVNADEKGDEYESIVSESAMCSDVLLATSMIQVGLNINNVDKIHHVFVGVWSTTDIVQAVARTRAATEITACLIRGENRTAQPVFFFDTLYKTAINNAAAAAGYLNVSKESTDVKARYLNESTYKSGDVWHVCGVMAANKAYKELATILHSNDEATAVELANFGIVCVVESCTTEAATVCSVKVEAAKAVKQNDFDETLKAIKTQSDFERLRRVKGKHVQAVEAVERVSKNFNITPHDAARQIEAAGLKYTSQATTQHIDTVKLHTLLSSDVTQMEAKDTAVIEAANVVFKFVGQLAELATVRTDVQNLFQRAAGEELTNKQAERFIRMCVKVKRHDVRSPEGVKVNMYKFELYPVFLGYLLNTQHKIEGTN